MQRAKKAMLSVGDRRIDVSNLDKVLYPGGKFSKAHVIDYYIGVSKYLLPHLCRQCGEEEKKRAPTA